MGKKKEVITEVITDYTNTTWENLSMIMAEYVRRNAIIKSEQTVEEILNRIKNFSAGHFQGCSSYVNLACDCPFGLSREALAIIKNQRNEITHLPSP